MFHPAETRLIYYPINQLLVWTGQAAQAGGPVMAFDLCGFLFTGGQSVRRGCWKMADGRYVA